MIPLTDAPLSETWAEMEKAVDDGLDIGLKTVTAKFFIDPTKGYTEETIWDY